ncbi:hypothetical protein ACFL49_03610, partial [Candidatus Omnitrophota bacterium]
MKFYGYAGEDEIFDFIYKNKELSDVRKLFMALKQLPPLESDAQEVGFKTLVDAVVAKDMETAYLRWLWSDEQKNNLVLIAAPKDKSTANIFMENPKKFVVYLRDVKTGEETIVPAIKLDGSDQYQAVVSDVLPGKHTMRFLWPGENEDTQGWELQTYHVIVLPGEGQKEMFVETMEGVFLGDGPDSLFAQPSVYAEGLLLDYLNKANRQKFASLGWANEGQYFVYVIKADNSHGQEAKILLPDEVKDLIGVESLSVRLAAGETSGVFSVALQEVEYAQDPVLHRVWRTEDLVRRAEQMQERDGQDWAGELFEFRKIHVGDARFLTYFDKMLEALLQLDANVFGGGVAGIKTLILEETETAQQKINKPLFIALAIAAEHSERYLEGEKLWEKFITYFGAKIHEDVLKDKYLAKWRNAFEVLKEEKKNEPNGELAKWVIHEADYWGFGQVIADAIKAPEFADFKEALKFMDDATANEITVALKSRGYAIENYSDADRNREQIMTIFDGQMPALRAKDEAMLAQGHKPILVVNPDDRQLHHTMNEFLARGFNVITASTFQEGLEVFEERKDEISISVIDLGVDRGDEGVELARKMHASDAQKPVVMYAYGEFDDDLNLKMNQDSTPSNIVQFFAVRGDLMGPFYA